MTYNLSNDQRRLLNMYISQYDQTSAHIERLTIMLHNIQNNIEQLISNHSNQTNSRNRYGVDPLFVDNILFSNMLTQTNRLQQNRQTNRRFNTQNTFSDILNNFLSTNVIVYPSEEQISSATRLVRYDTIITPLSTTCPISLEPFRDNQMVTQIIHCGHIFTTSELNNWFRTNVRCPVCRYDIREYRRQLPANASSNTSANIRRLSDISQTRLTNYNYDPNNYDYYVLYESDVPMTLLNTAFSYMRNNTLNNNNSNGNNNNDTDIE